MGATFAKDGLLAEMSFFSWRRRFRKKNRSPAKRASPTTETGTAMAIVVLVLMPSPPLLFSSSADWVVVGAAVDVVSGCVANLVVVVKDDTELHGGAVITGLYGRPVGRLPIGGTLCIDVASDCKDDMVVVNDST